MYKLGLIGNPLSHSFSKEFFESKFISKNITNFSYKLYNLKEIEGLNDIIHKHDLIGLNVTSPYKKSAIKYLDVLDDISHATQSVNTIFINKKTNKKFGFNTDYIGFNETLLSLNITKHKQALILGSGGVSSTISHCLYKKNINPVIVSRNPKLNMVTYNNLQHILKKFTLIINTTPLGQFPNINMCPDIPYELLSKQHHCIDLIYNPTNTLFLQKAKLNGASVINGHKMLIKQAEASWYIWNNLINDINV